MAQSSVHQCGRGTVRFEWTSLVTIVWLLGSPPTWAQDFALPYDLPPPTMTQPDFVGPQDMPPPGLVPPYGPPPPASCVEPAPEKSPWEGSLQLGINGSAGNAEAFSMRAGGDLKYESEVNLWNLDFTYAKTDSQSVLTQHNALFNAKYERLFESPWTIFVRFGAEYDEFKAFDLRLTLNTGLGYRLIDTDSTKLKGRFGAGVSREINGPDDAFVPEGVLGADFEHRFSDRQKFTLTSDYFPSWTDFADYRLVNNLGWEFLLDEASHLSLKLSAIDRYDSTPQGRKPNDLDYAILLMWKL